MTFEEFFIKKKIDLAQLRRAKPDLYEEFESHYAKMGEKSFDHTKKYWFNRLRKDYLLRGSVAVETKTVAATAVTSAPSGDISTPDPGKNTSTVAASPTGVSSMSPSGFKPRFKPGVTKPAEPAKDPIQQEPTTEAEAPKEAPEQTPAKPVGFKPRFKPGVTKPAASTEPAENKSAENKPVADETAQKAASPTGFKPRFKPGVTKPAIPAEPSEPAKDPVQQEPTAEPEAPKETPEQTSAKPLGFKPRFKPGITNKKNEDNE